MDTFPLPPVYPTRRPEVLQAAAEALLAGGWTRLEGVPETEETLERWHGTGKVWYLASGTAALQALLLGHEIGFGDEVITVPYTWGATVSAILSVGAVPVFADVDPATGLIDPAAVEPLITPRTRAILGVHLFGRPFDAPRLRALADRRNILLFEDGSQAHGATIDGQLVGNFGHGAAFSCMGLKPLAGTEGGYALFQSTKALETAWLHGKHPRGMPADRAEALRAEGLLDSLQLGWRPCVVGAALVRTALPFLEQENRARIANAETLRAELADVPWLSLPPETPGRQAVHHLMSFLYDGRKSGVPLDAYLEGLNRRGLGGFRYIPVPLHQLRRLDWLDPGVPRTYWHEQLRQANVRYAPQSFPGAEWRSQNTFEVSWNWTVHDPAAMRRLAQGLLA